MSNRTFSAADAHPLIGALLLAAVDSGASDLHLLSGYPPTCRIHGRLHPMQAGPLVPDTLGEMLRSSCPPAALERFLTQCDADFSFELKRDGQRLRFRANYFYAQGSMAACFRLIPSVIPTFEWSGFPQPLARRIIQFRNGLVLVTGVAGSGKTTTLAMIINLLSREGGRRIITVEEPVEYLFPAYPGSVVSQREVGLDVRCFSDGLKYGLRQDPDVILVGEIRDRDTAQMALSAAETGHMVFSTIHTRDAKGAVSRYADLFPQDTQSEIRSQLAMSLRAVVSQHLLPPTTPDAKRELALEVLFNNLPVSSTIRQGKVESIDNCIMTGKADGMVTLDESLRTLLHAGRISMETAQRFATDPHRLPAAR